MQKPMKNLRSVLSEYPASVWTKRLAVYLLGQFLMALGVSVSIRSNLGVSPVSSLPLVLGTVLHIEVGTMTTIVFCFYVLLQIALLGTKFPPVQLLQIACALLFGKFVTWTGTLISFWQPSSYLERFGMVLLATILVGTGVKMYLLARLIPQSGEGLVQTLSEKYHWKLANVKNVFDLTSVLLAAVISLLATGKITGLREGTVIAALGVGRVIWLLGRLLGDWPERFVYETCI